MASVDGLPVRCTCRSPVVSDEHRAALTAERTAQCRGVIHQRTDVIVAVARQARRCVAAGKWCNDTKSLGAENAAQVAPAPCAVGEAMQTDDESPALGTPCQCAHSEMA